MAITKKDLIDMLQYIPDNARILIDNPDNNEHYQTLSLYVNTTHLKEFNDVILTIE